MHNYKFLYGIQNQIRAHLNIYSSYCFVTFHSFKNCSILIPPNKGRVAWTLYKCGSPSNCCL